MKKLLTSIALLLAAATSFGATLNPIQLLNPAGSTSGQAIVSTGPTSSPAWASPSAAALTGVVPVLNGGTGVTTAAAELARIGAAPSASPTFTGTVTIPAGASISGYLTTASASATYAPSASPTFTGTPAAPSASAHTSTTQIATTQFVENELANPPAIGAGTPAAGTFTTLKASSHARLFYQNSSGQSFASATLATVTGWTSVFDANSNFNGSTGTFTAPSTGFYLVSGQIEWSNGAGGAVPNQYQVYVVANGVTVFESVQTLANTSVVLIPCSFSVVVSLTAGQTVQIKGQQTTGSAQTLNTGAVLNTLSITQLP